MEPGTRGKAAPIRRADRAFTMMELLVTLGILAVALASVLSIFARGSQFGLRAQERTEGGRVAQAVFDLIDRGFMISTRRGRRDDGSLLDETINCQELDFNTTGARELDGMQFRSLWKPAYVIRSHLDLVWRATISTPNLPPPAPSGLDWATMQGVHVLEVTVRFDGDGNGTYDEVPATPERLQPDRLVGEYYAILADREVSP